MPEQTAGAVGRAAGPGTPSWWRLPLRRSRPAGAGLLDTLFARLETPARPERHHRAVLALSAWAQRPDGLALLREPAALARLIAALERESVGGSPFDVPALHGANKLVFDAFGHLLARLGAAALPEARRLLAGPPRPVNVFGYAGSVYSAFGPQLCALAVLAHEGDAGDVPLLRRLALQDGEEAWVRLEAVLVWARWEPEAAARVAAAGCLCPPGIARLWQASYDARLASLGEPLVPRLLPHLVSGDATRQARAGDVLVAIGPVAVPALVALYDRAEDEAARDAVASALSRLDRRALGACESRRPRLDRGLSRPAGPADARRGLSRASAEAQPDRG